MYLPEQFAFVIYLNIQFIELFNIEVKQRSLPLFSLLSAIKLKRMRRAGAAILYAVWALLRVVKLSCNEFKYKQYSDLIALVITVIQIEG